MEKKPSTYHHPKHDQIAELVLAGERDSVIAARLGVHNRAVTRVRDILGVAHHRSNATTQEAKLARFSTDPDADGHTGWTGRTATSGAPVIRHLKVQIPASHVAFELRTGRPPVGTVMAECGRDYCLTPSHVGDEIERRNVRGQERALYGLDPVPWSTCPKDLHPWGEHGRFQPDLTPYCKGCNTERAGRIRRARKQEETSP